MKKIMGGKSITRIETSARSFENYTRPLLIFNTIFGLVWFPLSNNFIWFWIWLVIPIVSVSCYTLYLVYGMYHAPEMHQLLTITASMCTQALRIPNYYYYRDGLRYVITFLDDMSRGLDAALVSRRRISVRLLLLGMSMTIFTFINLGILMIANSSLFNILVYFIYSMTVFSNFAESLMMRVVLEEFGRLFECINITLAGNIEFITMSARVKPVNTKIITTTKTTKYMDELKYREKSRYFVKIFKLAEYHSELARVARTKVNEIFALPNLYIIGTEFCILVGTVNTVAIMVHSLASGTLQSNPIEILLSVYWIVVLLTHLYYVVENFRYVTKEASKTSTQFHHIWNMLAINDELDARSNHLQLVAMQMLNNKLSFTARGLFSLDRTLLQRIINATAVYVVILVQFHISGLKNQKEKQPI